MPASRSGPLLVTAGRWEYGGSADLRLLRLRLWAYPFRPGFWMAGAVRAYHRRIPPRLPTRRLAPDMPSCDGVMVTVDFVPVPLPRGIRPKLRAAAQARYSPAPGNEVTTRDLDPLRAASAEEATVVTSSSRPPDCRPRADGAVVPDPVR